MAKLLLPLSARVRRSAQSVTRGVEILDFIWDSKPVLVVAATKGTPPVGAISAELKRRFPDEIVHLPVRQFIGTAVKAVLLSSGFEVAQSGIRLVRDPVFRTGSTYRRLHRGKIGAAHSARSDLIAHLIQGLTIEERREFLAILKRSLGDDDDDT
jgi:hypothetical protein